jgi:hypothetical protein
MRRHSAKFSPISAFLLGKHGYLQLGVHKAAHAVRVTSEVRRNLPLRFCLKVF